VTDSIEPVRIKQMAATKTKVDAAEVRKVLTTEGWTEVRDFEAQPSGLTVGGVGLGDKVAYTIRNGTRLVRPATDILDVSTVDAEQEQTDRAQLLAERAAHGERVFAFVHYADRETFGAQVGKQGGICATCRTPVGASTHSHLDPDGLVRCPRCSVLKVRYGNQMPTARR
jgi:hypothetical protein